MLWIDSDSSGLFISGRYGGATEGVEEGEPWGALPPGPQPTEALDAAGPEGAPHATGAQGTGLGGAWDSVPVPDTSGMSGRDGRGGGGGGMPVPEWKVVVWQWQGHAHKTNAHQWAIPDHRSRAADVCPGTRPPIEGAQMRQRCCSFSVLCVVVSCMTWSPAPGLLPHFLG